MRAFGGRCLMAGWTTKYWRWTASSSATAWLKLRISDMPAKRLSGAEKCPIRKNAPRGYPVKVLVS